MLQLAVEADGASFRMKELNSDSCSSRESGHGGELNYCDINTASWSSRDSRSPWFALATHSRLLGTDGRYYCGQNVGCHLYHDGPNRWQSHTLATCRCNGSCGPTQGCQCTDCYFASYPEEATRRSRWLGSGGRYYCGQIVGQEGYYTGNHRWQGHRSANCGCNGHCGPAHGCQCRECYLATYPEEAEAEEQAIVETDKRKVAQESALAEDPAEAKAEVKKKMREKDLNSGESHMQDIGMSSARFRADCLGEIKWPRHPSTARTPTRSVQELLDDFGAHFSAVDAGVSPGMSDGPPTSVIASKETNNSRLQTLGSLLPDQTSKEVHAKRLEASGVGPVPPCKEAAKRLEPNPLAASPPGTEAMRRLEAGSIAALQTLLEQGPPQSSVSSHPLPTQPKLCAPGVVLSEQSCPQLSFTTPCTSVPEAPSPSLDSSMRETFQFIFKVSSNRLESKDKSVVSELFHIKMADIFVPFKVRVIAKQVHRYKHGQCFQTAKGRGKLELKCEGLPPEEAEPLTFSFSIGCGDNAEPARGPVVRDFLSCSVGSLPTDCEEFDFRGALDPQTASCSICLEVLPSPQRKQRLETHPTHRAGIGAGTRFLPVEGTAQALASVALCGTLSTIAEDSVSVAPCGSLEGRADERGSISRGPVVRQTARTARP